MDLSIIIPTLNESSNLLETLAALKNNRSNTIKSEIILIDAGSTDATVDLAQDLVDHYIVDAELKGAKYKSLNRGAELATGEVLFFLDADCWVPAHFDTEIMSCLEAPKTVGGAFEFKMSERSFSYIIIEFINRVRYRITQNYFGDQGLFCKRSTFEEIKGYPPEPIMEAAFLCRKLRKVGKLCLAQSNIVSSVRRFREGGIWRVFLKDALIWIQFLLHMDIKKYAIAYWAKNEKRE